jgi:glutamine synthetase
MKQFNFRCFKGVQGAVQHGTKIDRKLADYIAMGMRSQLKGVLITRTGFNH